MIEQSLIKNHIKVCKAITKSIYILTDSHTHTFLHYGENLVGISIIFVFVAMLNTMTKCDLVKKEFIWHIGMAYIPRSESENMEGHWLLLWSP